MGIWAISGYFGTAACNLFGGTAARIWAWRGRLSETEFCATTLLRMLVDHRTRELQIWIPIIAVSLIYTQ
jgi:hypothetical protein